MSEPVTDLQRGATAAVRAATYRQAISLLGRLPDRPLPANSGTAATVAHAYGPDRVHYEMDRIHRDTIQRLIEHCEDEASTHVAAASRYFASGARAGFGPDREGPNDLKARIHRERDD
jgi:hypothetical protein